MQSYTKGSTSVTYKYDENGLRTSKTVNGVQYDYYYVCDKLVYEKKGDEYELFYRYDADGRLAMVEKRILSTGLKYYLYIVTNSRGDVLEIRNGSGETAARFTYDAWGKVISIKDANGNILSESSFAGLISVRYRGYVYDSETGLYYLQSRYYDPDTGRFLNADDVNYIGLTESDVSYNLFAYCENEPVNDSDPLGYSSTPFSVITNLRKLLSKIVKPMSKVATILEDGLKGSRYYSAIKSMNNLSTTVYYEKEYDLCELYTVAQTLKWYSNERYTIITYSTTVENWYSIYNHVQKKLRNKSIADLVSSAFGIASGYVVGKYLAKSLLASAYSKLSIAAAIIGIPVGILILLASDSASKLEASLRYKKKTEIYTFNWIVGYSSQLIGQQSNSIILEYYCKWALLTGGMLV